ncbi:asparagine synthase (glutamine-hydrolyzing) [Clostridium sp. SYSU_GA19001]|uniref:asparagine synthase (glutamine-hydrolyzing) n=1 Tax=Clostridium caldaquaticum TaxID=2940653 RepID=UPI0020770671|nr:asparagine synthase (glutamine-hydrolyzing) [Clostridium caldaquaticum]MCM8711780.1 asparagine synthase (glutamine-hydrolyzing) [Clostridium caldaquaticum]
MCGIAGFIDQNLDLTKAHPILGAMIDTLSKRGPDASGIKLYKNAALGHRRLIVVDPEGGAQPMTRVHKGKEYTIVYNGELYNTEDVRKLLLEKGYTFKAYSDTEVLLTAFIEWGYECVKYINGIYAFGIWNEYSKELFLCRDPLGVKPLFYSLQPDSIIFASEIKALLKHPKIKPVVDETGLLEIFGLGPARTLGNGVFKYIKEVPPAHYLYYKNGDAALTEYWKLKAKEHKESFEETAAHTKSLLLDAIERQLVSDVPVFTFLSGGLDSSVISAIAAAVFKKQGRGQLNTFSIDYVDNNKYFKPNEYQPNSDSYYISKMVKFIGSNHHNVYLDNNKLAQALYEAVKANDLPGMADIDSSLYLFCREVRKHSTVGLSGECADEIFGGYPWFTRKEDINFSSFPWAKSLSTRKDIIGQNLSKLPIEDYVQSRYEETIKAVPKLYGEDKAEERMRELFYLNVKWFMITLLNRKDRMSMSNSLEVRVPFADYRLVEYAFNIPNAYKFYMGREKGLLREALKGIVPDEIIFRKKSPYPKTHNPIYTKAVQKMMTSILNDKSSPILDLINFDTVKEIVETGGNSFKKPWYGQLMTGPQVIAYLIQINIWLKEYNVQIEL